MIKINFLLLVPILFSACKNPESSRGESNEPKRYPVLKEGYIEVLDPEMEQVVSADAKIEILSGDHEFTEGPVWIGSDQMLLYSDIPRNTVYSWKEGEEARVFLTPSGFSGENFTGPEPGSNGLLLDPDGNLVLCQHGNRQIARMDAPFSDPKPSFVTIVNNYMGKRLNSPNDGTFNSNGDLYFTDPPYGLPMQADDPEKELTFQGVYRLDTAGVLTLLTDELSRPNGIAFSPDEKTLYVANSDPDRPIWMAYAVNEEGTLANGRVFYDATGRLIEDKGLPDGMKVDRQGIIYATGPGGVLVFNPEAKLLGVIRTGQQTANCGFNEDESELFITADMYLLRVHLK
jgi:gluconolactonase